MAKMEDLTFNKNEDVNKLSVTDLNKRLDKVYIGGGKKRIEKHHAKGKLTARERIAYLLDKNTDSIEIGAFAGLKRAAAAWYRPALKLAMPV